MIDRGTCCVEAAEIENAVRTTYTYLWKQQSGLPSPPRIMSRTPALLLSTALLLFVLTFAAQANAQITPHRSLDDATRKTLVAVMKRHPFEAFRAFGKGEEDSTQSVWHSRETTPSIREALGTAALAGLWSSDSEVTRGALRFVREHQMDIADIERYQRFAQSIVTNAPDDLDHLVDWDVFKHTASRDDITAILKHPPQWKSSWRYNFASNLHRSFRPEHIPVLTQLARTRDPFLREDAFKGLGGIALYTNQHRDVIARSILGWPGPPSKSDKDAKTPEGVVPFEPRSYDLPEKRSGFSPILHATIRRLLMDSREKLGYGIGPWLIRWTAESKADATDRELLLGLLDLPSVDAQLIALLGLRHLDCDDSREAIEKVLPTLEDKTVRALAHATLVARGSGKWRVALLKRAAEETLMCTAALAVMPELAVEAWATTALTGESARGQEAIEFLEDSLSYANYVPFRIADSTYDLVAQVVLERCDQLDADRLGMLIDRLPHCRSLALGKAFLRKMTPRVLTRSQLQFLLVVDDAGLRAKLASWLDDAGGEKHALEALLTIGSPEHGKRIVQYFKAKPVDDRHLLTLARSGESSAVRAYLADGLVGSGGVAIPEHWREHLTAYCRALGMPAKVCRQWEYALRLVPKDIVQRDYSQWQHALLAGKVNDVLFATLRSMSLRSLSFEHLSTVKDPRVVELLREVCNLQGANYQWAITELAATGDKGAGQVFQQSLDRSYYGWHENIDGRLLTLGLDRSLIPYWIGEIESNCCRRIAAGQALDALCGIDVTDTGNRCLLTARDWAEAWWRRNAERLRWSDLAGRYIIGPR